jgi:hypothetical protein
MSTRLPRWSIALLILVFALLLGVVDSRTGYELHFFVFYFMPISLAAWLLGLAPAIVLAVLSTLIWFIAGSLAGAEYPSHFHAVWNSMVRMTTFLIMAFSVSTIRSIVESERAINAELRKALSEIKVLGTLLPICAECKKIRDERGIWHPLEAYIGQRSNTHFSHGYCPECYRRALKDAGLTEDPAEQQSQVIVANAPKSDLDRSANPSA